MPKKKVPLSQPLVGRKALKYMNLSEQKSMTKSMMDQQVYIQKRDLSFEKIVASNKHHQHLLQRLMDEYEHDEDTHRSLGYHPCFQEMVKLKDKLDPVVAADMVEFCLHSRCRAEYHFWMGHVMDYPISSKKAIMYYELLYVSMNLDRSMKKSLFFATELIRENPHAFTTKNMDPVLYNRFVMFLIKSNWMEKAIEVGKLLFEKLRQLDKSLEVEAFSNLLLAYTKNRQYKKVIQACSQCDLFNINKIDMNVTAPFLQSYQKLRNATFKMVREIKTEEDERKVWKNVKTLRNLLQIAVIRGAAFLALNESDSAYPWLYEGQSALLTFFRSFGNFVPLHDSHLTQLHYDYGSYGASKWNQGLKFDDGALKYIKDRPDDFPKWFAEVFHILPLKKEVFFPYLDKVSEFDHFKEKKNDLQVLKNSVTIIDHFYDKFQKLQ